MGRVSKRRHQNLGTDGEDEISLGSAAGRLIVIHMLDGLEQQLKVVRRLRARSSPEARNFRQQLRKAMKLLKQGHTERAHTLIAHLHKASTAAIGNSHYDAESKVA